MKALFHQINVVLLLLTDGTFIFLSWLLRPDAWMRVSLFILLFTGFVTMFGLWWEGTRRRRILKAIEHFLTAPDNEGREALLRATGAQWAGVVNQLYVKLSAQEAQINESGVALEAYHECIEAWVHEIKTPLSLCSMMLHNHREEMSPYVFTRVNHVWQQLNENVARILYYARLQTSHADYRFEPVALDECVEEALLEYRPLAEERQIEICTELQPVRVITDRRVLAFMLAQLLSNALKYADEQRPRLRVSVCQDGDIVRLTVSDNGKGVAPEDAPFIFDKGFTGNCPNRPSATGMGLYLVKSYAEKMCAEVELEPVSTTGQGFGITLVFHH